MRPSKRLEGGGKEAKVGKDDQAAALDTEIPLLQQVPCTVSNS